MIIERDNLGFFGKTNAGKSSLMNLLTQQETSIVDPNPGTTTDTKITLAEIHGMGPVKFFDTAGFGEGGRLGEKKRRKALNDLKECDLILLVIDPTGQDFSPEGLIIDRSREYGKQLLVVYNLFDEGDAERISAVEEALPDLRFYGKISVNCTDESYRQPLLDFILNNFESRNVRINLLPFVEPNEYYILNIPMDEETPPGRYLRPQQMVEEFITRNWAYPVSYRMDLGKARSSDPVVAGGERSRFQAFLDNLKVRPKALISDSQAMDVIHDWTPQDIALTTFSIVMINYVTRGRLKHFAEGVKALDSLSKGDRILIAEACNHSRIAEDIGTVQIPGILEARFPGVDVEHSFGREFRETKDLQDYKLVIHCGGCMIDSQKMLARVRDLVAVGVPFTNYGILLSYIQGKDVLERVLKPFSIEL